MTHALAQAVVLAIELAFGGHELDLRVRPIACAGQTCSARASVATAAYVVDSAAAVSAIGRCTVYAYLGGEREGDAEVDLRSCRPVEKASVVSEPARRRGLSS